MIINVKVIIRPGALVGVEQCAMSRSGPIGLAASQGCSEVDISSSTSFGDVKFSKIVKKNKKNIPEKNKWRPIMFVFSQKPENGRNPKTGVSM